MTELHRSFDEVAELYDAARPTYPAELVEAVSGVLVGTQKRILEIGCGTGQATLLFAREGCLITALEPGQRLALLAAKNIAAFPQVSIQPFTFEEWPALKNQYDLVMSATAFHWIAPEVRYIKSAQALTDKGWLALFWNSEASDESAVGQQIQAAYDEHMPSNAAHPYATHHPAGHNQQQGAGISRWQQEIDQSHLFKGVSTMQFPWAKWYTTEQYLQLLETYSDHRALPPENKRRLFEEIAEALTNNGGGRSKPYLTTLYLAQVQKFNATEKENGNSPEMPQTFTSRRPAPTERKFTSPAVEETLQAVKAQIADPELAWLFENCYPNTLDTTVQFRPDGGEGGGPDTFVITGDIDAMWLRDSTAQVWPFLPLVKQDPRLQQLFAGVIRRQCVCILYDPYANAFMGAPSEKTQWVSDHTPMLPGIHERKWEIDSLCYPLRLAHGYWTQTGDASPFDAQWEQAMALILQTFREQQRKNGNGPYFFHRDEQGQPLASRSPTGEPIPDYGSPVQSNGLICSRFRPSDDATTFQYLIPSNFFAVAALRQMAALLNEVRHSVSLAGEATALADEVSGALTAHARAEHPEHGTVYPYEMDGLGGVLLMDDANVPSLLSLPYLGACAVSDPVYQATRRFVWSKANPWFFADKYAGVGSPHTGPNTIWPIALSMYALTSTSETEVAQVIESLKATHAGTGFMHESFHADDPTNYSRTWFAWANSLFGEMIVQTAARFPHLLR